MYLVTYKVFDFVSRLQSSFSSLFQASFGLIEMSDFVAVTDVESLIGRVIMSLWLLIGVIVLVNLLVMTTISCYFQCTHANHMKCTCVSTGGNGDQRISKSSSECLTNPIININML